jgi:hypothetical protein
MNKLHGQLTCVHNDSSANLIIKKYLYPNCVLGIFNTEHMFCSPEQIRSYNFPRFNKSIVYNTLKNNMDYYFVCNTKIDEENYQLISLLISQDRSVILVNCDVDKEILKLHVDKNKIVTYGEIAIKENLENF